MKLHFPLGIRGRLGHLSMAVVAALAATLGWLIDREISATIRASSAALLDQAQPILARTATTLIERREDAKLVAMLEEVAATEPFEVAACFELDGKVRAVGTRDLLTTEQQEALRRYGRNNSLKALQRAWRPAGMRFFQHPLIEPSQGLAPRGTLLLATNPPAVERRIAALRRYLWTASTIAGAAALLTVLFLARALARPLLALVEEVKRLERGLPAAHLATSRRDEIGGLARSFDRMANEVEACRGELKRRGDELAVAVARRKENLGRALRELDLLGERKDAFLSSVSHELRTPLTGLQASAEILANDAAADPAALAQFLPDMRQQARELDRLVDNLLCMLDLERHEHVAMPESSTLGALVDEALAMVELERASRDVTILRELDGDQRVRWDLPLLTRLLRELLLNGVRFTPRGGRVWIGAQLEGAKLRLVVEDEGPGIPVERSEDVFERFRQLGDLLTGKPKGTGLGLPICRAIAILHGGWIRAEARPGGGARLVLEVPVDASAGHFAAETPTWVLAELRP